MSRPVRGAAILRVFPSMAVADAAKNAWISRIAAVGRGDGRSKHVAAVRHLLRNGADPSWTDRTGTTMLHAAARHPGDRGLIRLLLHRGAVVDPVDPVSGKTPLHLAASVDGTADTVADLLAAGADPTIADRFGDDAWHAAAGGRIGALTAIIAAVGRPAVPDVAGGPLAAAARRGCLPAMEPLLGDAVPPPWITAVALGADQRAGPAEARAELAAWALRRGAGIPPAPDRIDPGCPTVTRRVDICLWAWRMERGIRSDPPMVPERDADWAAMAAAARPDAPWAMTLLALASRQ